MEAFRTEGVVLQAINFRDYDQIASVFTPDNGILKFIIRRGNSKKGNKAAPLTRVEIVYRRGKGEIHRCEELSFLEDYPVLRTDFILLQTACEMLKALQSSLYPEKPALQLYRLLLSCIGLLPKAVDPKAIGVSFLLKMMRHEGLLRWQETCSFCGAELQSRSLYRGESHCSRHAPQGCAVLNPDESQMMQILAFSQDAGLLKTLEIDAILEEKITHIFYEAFELNKG